MLSAANVFQMNNGASEFTKQLQTYARLIAEFGDCLSFDYFKPVKTERLVEKMAMEESAFPPIASMYTDRLIFG